jgi:two-component system nitrate/nitrite response regulator NarL
VNVLLCDDHRLFAESLALVLEWRGHQVICTTDPDDAVGEAATRPVDVVLMDLIFPGKTAVAAIRHILDADPCAKVMALSACTDAVTIARALNAGAVGFAAKDDDLDHILLAINRVARGDAVIDGATLRSVVRRGRGDAWTVGEKLTPRECEVLHLLAQGESTAAMAGRLGVTHATARTHVQNLLEKLQVHSRLEAVALAVSHGLVSPELRMNHAGASHTKAARTREAGAGADRVRRTVP